MTKTATTVADQIQKLKERGMQLDQGENQAKEVLLNIGYYRLGFYWHPFEKDKYHNFKEGTKFSDALALYYLDSDLRYLLTKYLNRIEINFKTKLIYEASNLFKKNPIWFVDPSVVEKSFINDFDEKVYNSKFIKNNVHIKKHHDKYPNHRYAPAWKTIEFFTFGNIITLFNYLKNEKLKNIIANHYHIKNLKVFKNHLKIILRLRNICSHSSRLYDVQLPIGINTFPNLQISGDNRKKLVSFVKLLEYYISKISSNSSKEMWDKIDSIMKKHKDSDVLKNIIETKTGYKFVN